MEYQQALIIGRRRRSDAALALSMYMQERATDVCAVKPAKGQGMDAKEWEPVGEQSFKEICIRTSLSGDKEAYLVLTDADGTVKACSQRVYPMQIALQIAWTIPLPSYAGPAGGWQLASLAFDGVVRANFTSQPRTRQRHQQRRDPPSGGGKWPICRRIGPPRERLPQMLPHQLGHLEH